MTVRRRLMWLVTLSQLLLLLVLAVPVVILVRVQAMQRADGDLVNVTVQVAIYLRQGPTVDEALNFVDSVTADSDVVLTVVDSTGRVHGPATPSFPTHLPEPTTPAQQTPIANLRPDVTNPGGVPTAVLFVEDGHGPWGVIGQVPVSRLDGQIWRSYATFAGIAAAALLVSLAGAWMLANRLTRPVTRAVTAARELGEGRLDVNVSLTGPAEFVELGRSLNQLAQRIDRLLRSERERAANLSHRLRTPLTALRLATDRLRAKTGSLDLADENRVLDESVNRLEAGLDEVIRESRRVRVDGISERSDLAAVVKSSLVFWEPLAEQQGRAVASSLARVPLVVNVAENDLNAAVDALVGNVFRHTPSGTGFSIDVLRHGRWAVLEVSDEGSRGALHRPGEPTAGSTKVGLRAARSVAQAAGGTLGVDEDPPRGLKVTLRLPVVE